MKVERYPKLADSWCINNCKINYKHLLAINTGLGKNCETYSISIAYKSTDLIV